MTAITVPALFAMSQGIQCQGPQVCAFCGGPCDKSHSSKPFRGTIKVTAANVSSQQQSESEHCCRGCFLSFREKTTVHFPAIAPETAQSRADGASVAEYSWFISPQSAVAYDCMDNPTHRKLFREKLMSPFTPKVDCWAAVCTTSKKANLFWMGKVNEINVPPFTVLVDSGLILYKPSDLQKRMDLVGRIKAVVHHCATMDEFYDAFLARYTDGPAMIEQWREVKTDPLSKLADFLAWEPEECDTKFPADKGKKPSPVLADVGEGKK